MCHQRRSVISCSHSCWVCSPVPKMKVAAMQSFSEPFPSKPPSGTTYRKPSGWKGCDRAAAVKGRHCVSMWKSQGLAQPWTSFFAVVLTLLLCELEMPTVADMCNVVTTEYEMLWSVQMEHVINMDNSYGGKRCLNSNELDGSQRWTLIFKSPLSASLLLSCCPRK